MSYIVKLYTLRAVLGLNGLLNQALVGVGILDEPSKAFLYNQRAVLLTMTVVYLPFVILPIFISLERIPHRLPGSVKRSWSQPARTFQRVVLPLSLPGTVAGHCSRSSSRSGISSPPRWLEAPPGLRLGGSSGHSSVSLTTGRSVLRWQRFCSRPH